MWWKCVGMLWFSLLLKPAAVQGQDAQAFPFYPCRGGRTYAALCNSLGIKLVFGVVLLGLFINRQS